MTATSEPVESSANVPALLSSVGFLEELSLEEDYAKGSLFISGNPAGEDEHYVEIDETTGKYLLVSREAVETGVADTVADDDYWAETQFYLAQLGASADECADYRVSRVMLRSYDNAEHAVHGKVAVKTQPLEKAIFVHRTVNGIRVLQNKFLFKYHLDGRLRKIFGRWERLDYEKSQFQSKYDTVEKVLDAVVQGLVTWDINPFFDEGISMLTVYSTETTADGDRVLDMKVLVRVPKDDGAGGHVFEAVLVDI